jgi:hypothetical protein
MKISNSKKQLAKIISENGGWRDGAKFAAQDQNAAVTFFVDTPWRCGTTWEASEFEAVDGFGVTAKALTNWHQTLLSRDEYFHLYPAPDADGWIEWAGGECPVAYGALVVVRTRDGSLWQSGTPWTAGEFGWGHDCDDSDIIAYRLHKPEQSLSELCDNVTEENKHEPVWTNPPTIEQLAADYRNAKDFAERRQQEADAAKADAEAKLSELVAAGKAIGLVLGVAPVEPEKHLGVFRNKKLGADPVYEDRARTELCENCGCRFGLHHGDANICLTSGADNA